MSNKVTITLDREDLYAYLARCRINGARDPILDSLRDAALDHPQENPIGDGLPEYTKLDPAEVRDFLDCHGEEAVEIGTKQLLERVSIVCPNCGGDFSGGGIDEPQPRCDRCGTTGRIPRPIGGLGDEERERLTYGAEKWRITSDAHCSVLIRAEDTLLGRFKGLDAADKAEELDRLLTEFDAWLSFRPEFSEVHEAFREAFGTDTSAERLSEHTGSSGDGLTESPAVDAGGTIKLGDIARGVEAMARREYEVAKEELGSERSWEEETQGHRNIYLDAARERLSIALAALSEHSSTAGEGE